MCSRRTRSCSSRHLYAGALGVMTLGMDAVLSTYVPRRTPISGRRLPWRRARCAVRQGAAGECEGCIVCCGSVCGRLLASRAGSVCWAPGP